MRDPNQKTVVVDVYECLSKILKVTQNFRFLSECFFVFSIQKRRKFSKVSPHWWALNPDFVKWRKLSDSSFVSASSYFYFQKWNRLSALAFVSTPPRFWKVIQIVLLIITGLSWKIFKNIVFLSISWDGVFAIYMCAYAKNNLKFFCKIFAVFYQKSIFWKSDTQPKPKLSSMWDTKLNNLNTIYILPVFSFSF